MWRVVTMTLVVLTALYNILLYADILQISIEPSNQVAANISSVETETTVTSPLNTTTTTTAATDAPPRATKFYLIPTPEITTDLLKQQLASIYYEKALNEESAEVWLHRGFERMTDHRTLNASEADVFVIAGYFHLAQWRDKARAYVTNTLMKRMHDKTMPHVVLCPTWNPETSRKSGIAHFISQLQEEGVNVWSVGFERNPSWQMVNASRIVPIPYVVRPSLSKDELPRKAQSSSRTDNFVFYAGDRRKHAVEWAGCNRSMIVPLENETNMDVTIRESGNRLSQEEYNNRMFSSEYCLILCGDTVTSRSLTSSMVYGCIPVRVGSRLRGLCELPCHVGWGWSVTGEQYPHLPFPSFMNWQDYPEVNELTFSNAPLETIQSMFQTYDTPRKARIRENILENQLGWVYGWGDPVTSNEFGQATEYVWQSIVTTLGLQLQ